MGRGVWCLTALGRQREMRRKPGTDLNFRAQFAGNSVSVPGFAPRISYPRSYVPQSG